MLLGALGLAIIGIGFYLSRTGRSAGAADACFWAGFVMMLAPSTSRVLAPTTPRTQRLFLVGFVGALTYAVKVVYGPHMFVLGDEFIHLSVAQHVASAHALFAPVSVQGADVASHYPGLESVAVGLSYVSGLSLFASGLILIGVARIIMMLALFRFAELVTRSPRAAGIASLIYVASGNFLFWSAQFSYESLALPMFVVAIGVLVERGQQRSRLAADLTLLLTAAALIATHHLTSYALAAVLWLFVALSTRRAWRSYRAVGLAVLTTLGAAAWFVFVAAGTRSYLSDIINRTVASVQQVAASSGGGVHVPFQSTSSGTLQTPLPEQVVSYLGALILGAGVVAVLLRYRRTGIGVAPGPLLAVGAALGFLALYPLRLAPGAWETANRGQDFFFFGAATLLGVAGLQLLQGNGVSRLRVLAVSGAVMFVICGGVIQGWPAPLRLPLPLRVSVGNRTIVPPGLDAVNWAIGHLGRDSVYAADEATGRELAVNGARFAYVSSAVGVPQMLHEPTFQPWELAFIRANRIDYAVVDRRELSADNLGGYFFQTASNPDGGEGFFPLAATQKFEKLPMVGSVFDSGDIRIYDVRGLWRPPPPCRDVDLRRLSDAVSCLAGRTLLSQAGRDGVVAFPGWQVRYLGSDVMPSRAGLTVSVRIQVENLTQKTFAASADSRHVFFMVGRARLHRLTRVALRRDNLVGTLRIPPGRQIQGSVSFRVHSASAISAVLRSGVRMYVLAPQPGAAPGAGLGRSPTLALIRLSPLGRGVR